MENEGTIIKKVGVGCFVKPYIRQGLYKKREDEWNESMKKIAKEVYHLDLSKDYMVDLAGKTWEDQKEESEYEK